MKSRIQNISVCPRSGAAPGHAPGSLFVFCYDPDNSFPREYRAVLELEAVIGVLKREFPDPRESRELLEQYLKGRF